MQQLSSATSGGEAAREVLSAVPPMIWFIRAQMRPHRKGLSLPQFRVLVFVNARPQASLSMLAENLGASLPTTSRIVGGLVEKGWLARGGCNGDRRQLALKITARGRSMLTEAWGKTRAKIDAELAPLNETQRNTITQAMQLLQGIFGAIHCPEALDAEGPINSTVKQAIDSASPSRARRRRNLSTSAGAK